MRVVRGQPGSRRQRLRQQHTPSSKLCLAQVLEPLVLTGGVKLSSMQIAHILIGAGDLSGLAKDTTGSAS